MSQQRLNVFTKFDDLEIARIVEHFTESLRHPQDGNACMLICTNGVYDKNKGGDQIKIATINKNPETAANALIHQAIAANDLVAMREFINHLRNIADCAERNIDEELKRRSTNN
jgi:serine/threonine protein phosphatase PrpC